MKAPRALTVVPANAEYQEKRTLHSMQTVEDIICGSTARNTQQTSPGHETPSSASPAMYPGEWPPKTRPCYTLQCTSEMTCPLSKLVTPREPSQRGFGWTARPLCSAYLSASSQPSVSSPTSEPSQSCQSATVTICSSMSSLRSPLGLGNVNPYASAFLSIP